MSRLVVLALLAFSLRAQDAAKKQEPAKEPAKESVKPEEQLPPEEDEDLKPKVYSFNPLQAQKELRTGNFYFKKGSFRAAANRFREATRWNPSLAEAWLRLGESAEKQKDTKGALEAYTKYLELEPDSKSAPEIKKKLGKLKR